MAWDLAFFWIVRRVLFARALRPRACGRFIRSCGRMYIRTCGRV
ncbi:hypothetical protein HMPREF3190_01568 [Umbribacter vaginalis]|nr:hypothetical protein HMPREF3190_01568 [Coriobacteriales bacterium DNF00809]